MYVRVCIYVCMPLCMYHIYIHVCMYASMYARGIYFSTFWQVSVSTNKEIHTESHNSLSQVCQQRVGQAVCSML